MATPTEPRPANVRFAASATRSAAFTQASVPGETRRRRFALQETAGKGYPASSLACGVRSGAKFKPTRGGFPWS